MLYVTRVAIADYEAANTGSSLYSPPSLPRYSLVLPRCSPPAPPLLPLKRPCSLSRTETAIPNPKFGVYIIYIYIFESSHLVHKTSPPSPNLDNRSDDWIWLRLNHKTSCADSGSPEESRNSRDRFGRTTCPPSVHRHQEALQWLFDHRGTTCSSYSTYRGHRSLTRELLSSKAFGRPRNASTTCQILRTCDGTIVMI